MDTVINLLVSRVAEIAEENVKLIYGIKDQVKELVRELQNFDAYLQESANKHLADNNAVLSDVVLKIQGIVEEAQDAIDQYVVNRRNHLSKGLMRYVEKVSYYKKVNDSAKNIDELIQRAKDIRQNHATALNTLQGAQPQPTNVIQPQPVVEEEDVVGFDGEAQTIKERLNDKSTGLAFISIHGMGGLGKTTLTKKVFSDSEVQYDFFTRLWVYVSQNMNRKQIFLNILSNFTKQIDDFKYMADEQLAERIKGFLEGGKYLIVMDDIWEREHFDLLKIAFPNNHKGSRVLVTTRNVGVATYADSTANPHRLKFLLDGESWELLQKKVFRKELCPTNIEVFGRRIAKRCNGLPLAVVVIAGVLNKESTQSEWIKVDEDPFPVINQDNQNYSELVRLSYDKLDFHKKKCFLYLSAFPIGHEISAWRVIRLWIAEGFIPSHRNMEGIAEAYLKDIVNRNLLEVLKRRADGEIKTCRLHVTLHEFCKSEALNNKLFHEIDGERIERNSVGYRRLCLRSSPKNFIDSEDMPSGEHIRSFLTSTKHEIPKEHLATIPKSYPFLKVFDAESFKFDILPKELYQLYHLCYLAISTDNSIIPKLFSDLWNLQTLVFNTSQSTIDVKAEIWNMPKLRHILANASLQFPPPSESCKENSSCPELQTLSTISPKSCTEEIFDKMPNLLKLGVRGDLSELLKSKEGICLFDNIQKLHNLEKLKLMHDAVNDQTSIPRSFPRANKFPRKLRKLTLSKTSFDWKDICILGSLEELEVLKLEEFAAKGDSWELSKVVFKSLKFLRIGRTDLEYWSLEKYSFPVLKWLYISQCEHLNEVPLAFKDVRSLKVMDLFYTNERAANSARKIGEQKPREDRFELSIFPPGH